MEPLFEQNDGKQHESYNDNDHYEPALVNEEQYDNEFKESILLKSSHPTTMHRNMTSKWSTLRAIVEGDAGWMYPIVSGGPIF